MPGKTVTSLIRTKIEHIWE